MTPADLPITEVLSCYGKVAYRSPADAVVAVQRMKKGREAHKRASHYRCRHCGRWHVGNSTPPRS